MAIAEDVRNLFREFDGRAESYIEFDPGRPVARPDGYAQDVAHVAASLNGTTHTVSALERAPAQAPALDAVFARLSGRAG